MFANVAGVALSKKGVISVKHDDDLRPSVPFFATQPPIPAEFVQYKLKRSISAMDAPYRISCMLAVLLLLAAALTSAAMSLPFTKQAQSSRRAVVYKHLTLEQALHDASQHAGTAVLIVGTTPPRRRAPQQPLLLFSTRAASQVPYAVQHLLVQGLTQLQHLSGGNVGRYCLVLDALSADPQEAAGVCAYTVAVPHLCLVPFTLNTPPCRLDMHTGDGWPLVVFDASTGSVLLGPTVLQALQSAPAHVVSAAVQAMMAAAQQLMHLGGQVGGVEGQAGGQLGMSACAPPTASASHPPLDSCLPCSCRFCPKTPTASCSWSPKQHVHWWQQLPWLLCPSGFALSVRSCLGCCHPSSSMRV